jgi:uncharacterized damage-inducible protein DinB
MELKKYLTDTFGYNDYANKLVLEKIKILPDKAEGIRLFSHLINCQYKWLARIEQDPHVQEMDWWNPLYEVSDLGNKWSESLTRWLNFITASTEHSLLTEVKFVGFDGSLFAATPWDIALQLNYHSIHHRAQIQSIIREQGFTPDFVDYIKTKYRKLDS